MSIEYQSRRPTNPLRRFLDQHLPQRHEIADVWRKRLDECDDIGVDGDRAHLGQALEMRIGLDLGTNLSYQKMLGYLPASQCTSLLRACGLASHDGPSLPIAETSDPMLRRWVRDSHPIRAGEAERSALNSVLLATEFDSVAHRKITPVVQLQRRLLAAAFDTSPDDTDVALTDSELLEPLTYLWQKYLTHGRPSLLAFGERVLVSPEIVPGFATADLVVGLTLVEIKTSIAPGHQVNDWLDQLLGYLLVDRWDTLRITQLALYSGWHGATQMIAVDELLSTATRGQLQTSATCACASVKHCART